MAVLPRSTASNQNSRHSLMLVLMSAVTIVLGLLIARSAFVATPIALNGNFAPINGDSMRAAISVTTSTVVSAPVVNIVPESHSNNSGADFRLYFICADGSVRNCGAGKVVQIMAYYLDYDNGGKSTPGFSYMLSDLAELEAGLIVQVGPLTLYKLPSGEYQLENTSRGKTRVVIFDANGVISRDFEK